ncbi:sulfate/molybdate ABC transporter ATP-binding protein [Desulfosporosinus sp. PR]|uniref:sulfate/molybdate ABC transporter ATP-binding protein n=1 Tax=Candidatus Desulfosporosinus nitrosoreducens TaxID=3401928 RepID=UPI0027F95760|nr:sulfate/molybdate ABC transporter ATP-binding protein [Desulfosporosinus sp. PR]MDQ7093746.1 sulfate/molybdate ABC transporter ATP-binding protein [Desulfosporosinus sp. PR]
MELFVDIQKKFSGFELKVEFEADLKVLGFLGASGSGKSMTLRCVAGIETPDCGRIVLNGRTLYDSQKGINLPCRQRRLGYVFQNYALFPHMTVAENIAFGLGDKTRAERRDIIENMVSMTKVEGLEKRFPGQLSGGQQQRVALARALAVEPQALLLDEPFSALDDYLRSYLVKQLKEILSDYQGVALFVSHNMEEIYSISDQLIILSSGKIEATGQTKEVFMSPPSLTAAQLTGCHNVSPARYISVFELEALQWGIILKTGVKLTRQIKYVGIRAHMLEIASGKEEENVFSCWLVSTDETPSRVTVCLSLDEEKREQDSRQVQWEITKQLWVELKDRPQPWRLHFKTENLIII